MDLENVKLTSVSAAMILAKMSKHGGPVYHFLTSAMTNFCWYIVCKYIVAEHSEATNLDDGSPILS